MQNYSYITVLPTISEILEKVVHTQLFKEQRNCYFQTIWV